MGLTESEFQRLVIDVARLRGWVVYHVPDSRRVTARGCPDLIMIHERQSRLIFAELKTETGKLSDHQKKWMRVLVACGVETYLWRPSDMAAIKDILGSPCHPPTSDRVSPGATV